MASAMVMTSNGGSEVENKKNDSSKTDDKTDKNEDVNDVNTNHTDEDKLPSEKSADTFAYPKIERRVKVYLLKNDNWIDNGTGFCTGEIENDTKRPFFLVKNELDQDDIILKSFLEGTTQYQRQQDTLIVWTDTDGKDIALSFQETEGCADLCEFIVKVQQENLSPNISLYYVISANQVIDETGSANEITELITGPIKYPDLPTMDNLEEVLELFNQASTSNYSKGRILKYLLEQSYLSKLIAIFNQSEESHNLINLYSLSEIIKTLILYSESSILQDFLDTEEKILGIIGILEYDAEYPNQKSCHRQFLKERANFKVVVQLPIEDDENGLNIFKKDFYYTFLKDVILARFVDDQTFNLLNALIHLNQIMLLDFLRDSERNNHFLEKLFKFYQEPETTDLALQRNGIKLLHQYVLLTKNLPTNQRTIFFSELILHGLIDMIKFSLSDEEISTKALGTELIVSIIEQDVSLVNSINDGEAIDNSEPPMEQTDDMVGDDDGPPKEFGLKLSDDMTLMSLLTLLLLQESTFGLKTQAFEALKVLLDQNIGKVDENGVIPDFASSNNSPNDISTDDYFKAFYTGVAPLLYKNLIELGNVEEPSKDLENLIKRDELLYQQLCELFSFCILTHDKTLQRSFFIENNILLGITRLLKFNCKMSLKLSVISCLSNVLAFGDKVYIRYVLKNGVIDTFFEFFKTVAKSNNLANSSCLSLLEVLNDLPIGRNKAGFKALIAHIYNNYKTFCLEELDYVQTGFNLIRLHEQLDTSHLSLGSSSNNIDSTGDLVTDGDIIEDEDEIPPLSDANGETSPKVGKSTISHKNLFDSVQQEYEATKEKRQNPFVAESESKRKTTDVRSANTNNED